MAKAVKKKPGDDFERRLILFRYFLNLFGIDSLTSLAGELNTVKNEGLTDSGNTLFWEYLNFRAKSERAAINLDTLKVYDENIIRHVKHISTGRGGIKLKYFQYIACLFTEAYLDHYFTDATGFARELNAYADSVKTKSSGEIDITPFEYNNMNKLVFMCATGSGKTLIMHINILQFQYYLERKQRLTPAVEINNIILITPNERMSQQHLKEFNLSHITANLFTKSMFALNTGVIIIDINKLEEEGINKTISVDSFEQNNLVLVDEAHRGLAANVEYGYRSRLSADSSKGGFAFEYSATIRQALKSNSDIWKKRQDDYYRSIIFDYSYKYFYEDGYGKEYRIYNLRERSNDAQRQLYLVGCILSFYLQLKLYEVKGNDFADYNIEKPLLVFVGNRVTEPVKKESKSKLTKDEIELLTDVAEIIDFLNRFIRNKSETTRSIHTVLHGNSGISDSQGKDIFRNLSSVIPSLFGAMPEPNVVYADILRLLFNCSSVPAQPRLCAVNLRRTDGEIALRVGKYGEDFGVISVGDTTKLMKLIASSEIEIGSDEFRQDSLFGCINEHKSKVNVLIGSRKFTEGWNSWRVSTMGLINFGKSKGSQAIQLFGRGVRLHGYKNCLKRSSKLGEDSVGTPPDKIEIMETLTIFGVKADYMEYFREYLEREGLPPESYEYTLSVLSRYDESKHKNLRVINLKDNACFEKQASRLLLVAPNYDEDFSNYLYRKKITIDCRPRVESIDSKDKKEDDFIQFDNVLPVECLPWLDYERIVNELEQYKEEKGYFNISLRKDELTRIIMSEGWYSLNIPDEQIELTSVERLEAFTDLAIIVLKKYIDKFYKYEKNKWEEPRREYGELKSDNSSFVSEYKIVYKPETGDENKAEDIRKFVKELNELLAQHNELSDEKGILDDKLVVFDLPSHLFTPLVYIDKKVTQVTVTPIRLNEGEKAFVNKLKKYVDDNPDKLDGMELYLFRNKSVEGMGFFALEKFYPDFIMWIDAPGVQYISFIDPKGLLMVDFTDSKVELYKEIKQIERQLQSSGKGKMVVLNSFIMSATKPAELDKRWNNKVSDRHAKNVFCLDERDCIGKMMEKILAE